MTNTDIKRLAIICTLSLICSIILFTYASLLAYIIGTILGLTLLMAAIITGRILIRELKHKTIAYFKKLKSKD